MTKQEQIEEMTKIVGNTWLVDLEGDTKDVCEVLDEVDIKGIARELYEKDCRKLPEDSVVLSREEYEMLKSLYDTQKGAIMTSSVGDLPLTVEGLRKAVDEITRLNRVETELQELNAKYYNEAKDLRRELKQTRKDTAKAILNVLYFNLQNSVMGRIQEIAKNYGVEVEE